MTRRLPSTHKLQLRARALAENGETAAAKLLDETLRSRPDYQPEAKKLKGWQ